MQRRILLLAFACLLGSAMWVDSQEGPQVAQGIEGTGLTTVAIQTCNMQAMEAFYADLALASADTTHSEAIKPTFRTNKVGPLECRVGKVGGITLKLVPLREAPDFEGYRTHQLGFLVQDIDAALAAAKAHGGKQEGEVVREEDGRVYGCVRDPDGNTIEIYSSEK